MFTKVAKTSEFKSGDKKRVKLGDEFVLLAKIGEKYFAVSDTCTHQDASLCNGTILDEQIECPWHGAKFDLKTGEAKTLPAVTPLKKYEVKIEEGDILIK